MVRYKLEPPALPGCIDRPRPLGHASPWPVVVLAAPGGSGKTCLAAQIAAVTGGPTAWFLADELDRDEADVARQLGASFARAWVDLEAPDDRADDAVIALAVLRARLETLAGPGCVVLDDVHLLPGDVLEVVLRVLTAALPADCRLVVCTRGPVPQALARASAAGRAVTLGPADLAFDLDECGRASDGGGEELLARTGGWPLAVALLGATERWNGASWPVRQGCDLTGVALCGLDAAARRLLTVLTRIPRFPRRLLTRLGARSSLLEEFCWHHQHIIGRDGEWWAPREWLHEALARSAADPCLVGRVSRALLDLDEVELAAELLVSQGRFEDAMGPLERLADDGLRRGRPAWVQGLIASVPICARSFHLELAAAKAAQGVHAVDGMVDGAATEPALLALVARAAEDHPDELLAARALLANHYRMAADARVLGVCEEALGDALRAEAPERVVAERWTRDDVPAAAEMLRFYGQALLLAADPASIARGRRLVAAAIRLLDGVGSPTMSIRSWSTYLEVLLFLVSPAGAIPSVRHAAHRVAEVEHSDSAVRMAELATIEFFAGDHHAARASIERARECAERTGNRIALPSLAAIEVALDVAATTFGPSHAARFDNTIAQLEADAWLARFTGLITAELGLALVRLGYTEPARRYHDRAVATITAGLLGPVTSFRCRRLEGLVLVAEGDLDEGRRVLEGLRADAAAAGRSALVELVDDDLAGRPTGHHLSPAEPHGPPVRITVLAPELSVHVDGDRVSAPRGFPAKLLALLIAADGVLTIDAAIEGLWPETDPDVGRNRLHGVLLRLRRSLGLPASGPISCSDDVVRLEANGCVRVDSWEFAHHAARAASRPELGPAALTGYTGAVLPVQFAYDDSIETYRRALHRTFLRLAAAVLDDPPADLRPDELADLARHAADLAGEDEPVCLAAAATLARLGHHAESRHVVARAADRLDALGLDSIHLRDALPRLAM